MTPDGSSVAKPHTTNSIAWSASRPQVGAKCSPLLKKAKAHEAQVVSALGADPAHQLKLMLESLIAAHGST